MLDISQLLRSTATKWGSSRWSTFRRCHREHSLRYALNIVPDYSNPDNELDTESPAATPYFDVGTIVHAVLAYMSEGAMLLEPAPRDWYHVIQTAQDMAESTEKRFLLEIVDESEWYMRNYFDEWGLDNAGWPEGAKVLAIELPLAATDLGPLPFSTQLDIVLELRSGEVLVVDHKSRKAGIPGSKTDSKGVTTVVDSFKRDAFARSLATRTQFLGASFLAQRHFDLDAPPRIMHNAIIKTKIPKFDRLVLDITQHAVDQWAAWQSLYGEMNIADDTPNPDACVDGLTSSRCRYFTWCHGTHDERQRHYKTLEIV